MNELIKRLEAIARKNKCRFRYRIHVTPDPKGLRYFFYCEDMADGRVFVSGSGDYLEQAAADALGGIGKAEIHQELVFAMKEMMATAKREGTPRLKKSLKRLSLALFEWEHVPNKESKK